MMDRGRGKETMADVQKMDALDMARAFGAAICRSPTKNWTVRWAWRFGMGPVQTADRAPIESANRGKPVKLQPFEMIRLDSSERPIRSANSPPIASARRANVSILQDKEVLHTAHGDIPVAAAPQGWPGVESLGAVTTKLPTSVCPKRARSSLIASSGFRFAKTALGSMTEQAPAQSLADDCYKHNKSSSLYALFDQKANPKSAKPEAESL